MVDNYIAKNHLHLRIRTVPDLHPKARGHLKLVLVSKQLQGVPTSLGYVQKCLQAKRATFTKKFVFRSKKLLFEPFL